MVINCPLSASSIYYDPWHPSCSIHAPESLFPQSLSEFSLIYLLAWHPPLHNPYISSPDHCLLFTTHAHTMSFCWLGSFKSLAHSFCFFPFAMEITLMFPYACMVLLTIHMWSVLYPSLYFSSLANVHLHQCISTLLPLPYLWPCFGILHVFSSLSFPYTHYWFKLLTPAFCCIKSHVHY